MKITDIVSQKQQVDEAPVGILKRAGLGIASKLGSTSAKGALDTATMANGLRKQFDYYLGQTDQKPNSDAIIAFLSTNGFPTAGAETAIKQAAMAAGTMPAKDMRATLGVGKNAGEPMATPNPKDSEMDPEAGPMATGEADPEMDPEAGPEEPKADSDEKNWDDYEEPAYKRKGIKNPFESIDELSRIAQLAGMSYTPVQTEEVIDEVNLKNSTVDAIIKAAVTDILKANMGQKLDAVISGQGAASPQAINKAGGNAGGSGEEPSTGIAGAFMKGMKRGITGDQEKVQTKGNLNYGKLSELLPGVDPNQLKKAIGNYMSGNNLTRDHMNVMAGAFGEIVKMDPAQTAKVLQLLKTVRAA